MLKQLNPFEFLALYFELRLYKIFRTRKETAPADLIRVYVCDSKETLGQSRVQIS